MVKDVMCKRCGHNWKIESTKVRVTCANCGTSVKINFYTLEELKQRARKKGGDLNG